MPALAFKMAVRSAPRFSSIGSGNTPPKSGSGLIADRQAIDPEFSQDLPQKISRGTMHGIGHDARLCFLNDAKINQRLDVVEVLLARRQLP